MEGYEVEEDVFWFDVSVDDLLLVDVVQSLTDLPDDRTAVGLLHPVGLPQGLQQLPPRRVLHKQVHVLLVREVPIEWRYVAVRQVELDAQLTGHLTLVLLLTDLLLAHNFHGAQEARPLVHHHHHLAELPLPQLLTHHEVTLAKLMHILLLFLLSLVRRGVHSSKALPS